MRIRARCAWSIRSSVLNAALKDDALPCTEHRAAVNLPDPCGNSSLCSPRRMCVRNSRSAEDATFAEQARLLPPRSMHCFRQLL
jgi:hypothetical protein